MTAGGHSASGRLTPVKQMVVAGSLTAFSGLADGNGGLAGDIHCFRVGGVIWRGRAATILDASSSAASGRISTAFLRRMGSFSTASPRRYPAPKPQGSAGRVRAQPWE